MFSFRKLYLLECVGFLNVANLFPDVCIIVGSKVFEANIWTLQTSTSLFLNSSLFWQLLTTSIPLFYLDIIGEKLQDRYCL